MLSLKELSKANLNLISRNLHTQIQAFLRLVAMIEGEGIQRFAASLGEKSESVSLLTDSV